MDQNPNDNLFLNNEPPKEPEQPRVPEPFVPAEPVREPEPFIQAPVSSGAQVYPPTPGFEPSGPQVYTPPPAPPAAQPPKSNRNIWIIVIVVVVLLCCCCLALAAVYAWNNGDQWLEDYSFILPLVKTYLA